MIIEICFMDKSTRLKLLDELQPYLLSVDSDEARKLIDNSRKVEELWHDSEITNTKAGKLYGKRSHLHISYTFLEDGETLWDKYTTGFYMIITDLDKVIEIIKKYSPNFYSLYYEILSKS